MAGDWIKATIGLRDDPRIIALAHELDYPDADMAVGKCLAVWGWGNAHTVTGALQHATVQTIDAIARQSGFAVAMKKVGWLEERNGTLWFPRWDRHNSKSAKDRVLAAERMKRFRDAAIVTKPSPEKRREEKRDKDPLPPTLPFQSQAFSDVWQRWEKHRTEIKHKLTPSTRTAQLKSCQKHGEPVAITAIERSIESGWQKLVWPEEQYRPTNGTLYGHNGAKTPKGTKHPTNPALMMGDRDWYDPAKQYPSGDPRLHMAGAHP